MPEPCIHCQLSHPLQRSDQCCVYCGKFSNGPQEPIALPWDGVTPGGPPRLASGATPVSAATVQAALGLVDLAEVVIPYAPEDREQVMLWASAVYLARRGFGVGDEPLTPACLWHGEAPRDPREAPAPAPTTRCGCGHSLWQHPKPTTACTACTCRAMRQPVSTLVALRAECHLASLPYDEITARLLLDALGVPPEAPATGFEAAIQEAGQRLKDRQPMPLISAVEDDCPICQHRLPMWPYCSRCGPACVACAAVQQAQAVPGLEDEATAPPPPQRMYQVGVEGDRFHDHAENEHCPIAGCVPVEGEPTP